jgi:hypothetical protein
LLQNRPPRTKEEEICKERKVIWTRVKKDEVGPASDEERMQRKEKRERWEERRLCS